MICIPKPMMRILL
ncbi:hypothetical protein A3Q56_06194, partial [Intoshia linei]